MQVWSDASSGNPQEFAPLVAALGAQPTQMVESSRAVALGRITFTIMRTIRSAQRGVDGVAVNRVVSRHGLHLCAMNDSDSVAACSISQSPNLRS